MNTNQINIFKNKRIIIPIILLIILLVFVAIFLLKPEKKDNDEVKEIKAESIVLNTNVESLLVGENITLEATIYPEGTKDKIIWSSSDETIATVEEGIVTGIQAGTVTITARINDEIYEECLITVYEEQKVEPPTEEPPVEEPPTEEPPEENKDKTDTKVNAKSISLNKTSLTLEKGETATLKATITPSNTSNKNITWSSSNTNIVKVQNGVVTGINPGSATITAKTSNGKTATCTIKVEEIKATSLTLNQTNIGLKVGQSTTISTNISPSNATNKNVTWKSSNTSVATVSNGTIKGISPGTSAITATIDDISVTMSVKVYSSNEDNVKVNFLNTQNNPNIDSTYGTNLAVLLQTKDNKYVLVDTGNRDDDIVYVIYNALKKAQGTDKVVIDYMIVSHLDDDHYGNAVTLINNSKINVKNVIVKYEKTAGSETTSVYKKIVKAAANNGTHIITSPNTTSSDMKSFTGKSVSFDKLSEEYQIKVGNYLNLYLYNTNDIYIGKSCKEGKIIKYKAKPSSSEAFKIDGKYVMFDNTNGVYPNVTYQLVDSITAEGTGFNRKFYAISAGTRNSCRSNANSIATFAAVKIDNGNDKYIYLPGDLDNNGYDITSTNGIIGTGTTNLYNPLSFDITTNKFITKSGSIVIAAESNVAKAIANSSRFKGKLNNIVIYQQSHHGLNNAPDAINTLNLNRSGVYAIATTTSSLSNSNDFLVLRSYYYTLSNVPENHKMRSGNSKNGILCNITYTGNTTCSNY